MKMKLAGAAAALALGFAPAAKAATSTYIYDLTATDGSISPDPATAVIKVTFDPTSSSFTTPSPSDVTLISDNLGVTPGAGQAAASFFGTGAQNILLFGVGTNSATGGDNLFYIEGAGTSTPNFLEGHINGGDTLDGTVTQTLVSAAPEPQAWLMMLAGIALVGGALRMRRSQQSGALAI